MAPLEIRLDHAGTTGPLYALGARNGSRPTGSAKGSRSQFWQLCDRSPATNRGLCRCALNWVGLRLPEALPVPFVSPANEAIFADCDEAGGTVRATRSVTPRVMIISPAPASLMMRAAALSTIPAMPKRSSRICPRSPSVVFTGPLRSGYRFVLALMGLVPSAVEG